MSSTSTCSTVRCARSSPVGVEHRVEHGRLPPPGHPPAQHVQLLVPLRVAEADPEQEPVELRLGQRVGPLVLDRVRGGDHVERLGQRERGALDRDLPLLHRLQQRRLGLRRGAVDLVGEQQPAEQRAGPERELGRALVVHERAGDVAGQQVGGELQAAEVQPERLGQRAGGQRLAEAGVVLEQHVAAGEDAGQHERERVPLADHDLLDRVEHRLADRPDVGQRQRGQIRSSASTRRDSSARLGLRVGVPVINCHSGSPRMLAGTVGLGAQVDPAPGAEQVGGQGDQLGPDPARGTGPGRSAPQDSRLSSEVSSSRPSSRGSSGGTLRQRLVAAARPAGPAARSARPRARRRRRASGRGPVVRGVRERQHQRRAGGRGGEQDQDGLPVGLIASPTGLASSSARSCSSAARASVRADSGSWCREKRASR